MILVLVALPLLAILAGCASTPPAPQPKPEPQYVLYRALGGGDGGWAVKAGIDLFSSAKECQQALSKVNQKDAPGKLLHSCERAPTK